MTRRKKPATVLKVGETSIPVEVIAEDYFIGRALGKNQYVPIYNESLQDYIVERCKDRVRHGFDCPVLITGPRRTGKSTNAINIARKLDRDFSHDRIAFRLEDFSDLIANLPPADPSQGVFPAAIYDEAGTGLYSKDWMRESVKVLCKVFQIVGKKNLTLFLCLPHRAFLTKDIREQLFLWIYTTTLNEQRGFAELREVVENKWSTDAYWKPLCGYIFNELKDPFWLEYERRKMQFIDDFTRGVINTPIQQRNLAIKRLKDFITLREICSLTGLSSTTVSNIVSNTRYPENYKGGAEGPLKV